MGNYSTEERVKVLSSLGVFEGLEPAEIEKIAEICDEQQVEKGATFFNDCSPGTDMYLLLKGRVSIRVETITPHYNVGLTKVSPGEVFGEFSLIDSEPRSATASATEPCEVLKVDGDRMRGLFDEHTRMGYVVMTNLAKTICAKIRRTNKQILNLIRAKLYD